MTGETHVAFISGWGSSEPSCRELGAALPAGRFRSLSWRDILSEGRTALDRALPPSEVPCVLAGWSLGALLALQAALATPERFDALILISATGRMTAAPDHAGVAPRVLRAMRLALRRRPEAVLRDFVTRCMIPDGNDGVASACMRQALAFGIDDLALGLDALAKLDLRKHAARLAVPLLLVHGAEDHVIPIQACRELATSVPRARLEIIAARGHALPLLAPSLLAALIKEFLK